MKMTENSCSQTLGASRSIYYSLTEEVPGLTDEEKDKLEAVMRKAMEFEAEEANRMRQPIEGVLYKYTNVVKGWQYRWFILTPDSGMLEYFMVEEKKKSKPRGGMHLAGATVLPNDEDSLSFVVTAMYGEVYKLKANDAKERQFWVDRIRSVIEKYPASHLPIEAQTQQQQTLSQSAFALCKVTPSSEELQTQKHTSETNVNKLELPSNLEVPTNSLTDISESVSKALECQRILAKSIEDLPISGQSIKCSDNRLLLIKAISQASVQSLEQCYFILRRRRQAYMPSPVREIKNLSLSPTWKF